MSENPRVFHLQRDVDVTGMSGTGQVADGVVWPDGSVTVRWRGERPSTVCWASLEDAESVHGHGGKTRVVFDAMSDVPRLVVDGGGLLTAIVPGADGTVRRVPLERDDEAPTLAGEDTCESNESLHHAAQPPGNVVASEGVWFDFGGRRLELRLCCLDNGYRYVTIRTGGLNAADTLVAEITRPEARQVAECLLRIAGDAPEVDEVAANGSEQPAVVGPCVVDESGGVADGQQAESAASPLRAEVRNRVESAIYEFRERTALWDEGSYPDWGVTGRITECVMRALGDVIERVDAAERERDELDKRLYSIEEARDRAIRYGTEQHAVAQKFKQDFGDLNALYGRLGLDRDELDARRTETRRQRDEAIGRATAAEKQLAAIREAAKPLRPTMTTGLILPSPTHHRDVDALLAVIDGGVSS